MRSDDAKETRRDISADELLRQLNESVYKSPTDKSGTGGSGKSKADAASAPKATVPKKNVKTLSIDDDVYEGAQRGIAPDSAASSDPDKLSEDAEIDALLKKYLNREKRSEPIEKEAPTEPSVKITETDVEPVREEVPATAEEPAVEEATADEDSDVKTYMPDAEDESDAVDVDRHVQEDSEILAAAALLSSIDEDGEPTSNGSVQSSDPDDASTAVFDIQQIHALTPKPSDESIGDQATGIFTPVSSGEDKSAVTALEAALNGEETASSGGEVKSEEIDQTDLHLMIAFGMNDELKDKVGEEKASELESELEKEQQREEEHAKQVSHYEYTSRSQNGEIVDKYQNSYYGAIARIACAILLFGMMFVLENFSLFGLNLPLFMRPEAYPVVYTMIDLQFIVFGCALIFRHLLIGVKNLTLLRPTTESLTAFSMLLSIFYTIVSCLSAPRVGYRLFNLPIMALVIFALVYDFLKIKRDVFGFSVISAKKKKIIVTPVSEEESASEREVFREYLGERAKIVRVGKTDFVDGFFSRVGKDGGESSAKPLLGILIPAVLVIIIAFFAIGYIKSRSLYEAMKLAFISATMTLPISAYIVYSLPLYRAARQAYDSDSAIIGEASIEEYAGSSVISFEDKEVFPPKGAKVTSIRVFGNNRIDQIIYNLASAFIKVGGPLAEVFGQATVDMGHSENVELKEVDEDGFTVVIDDVQVSIGKASYMERIDLEPSYDAEDKQIEETSTVGIFYIAYRGELAAKVFAEYTIDAEFEKILNQLYKTGMCVGIKSFDPNINDLMLSKKLKKVGYPVKVIRAKSGEDIPHALEHCESGIVSKRSVKSLLRAVASCERVSSAVKSAQIAKILGVLIGLVIMLFMSFFKVDFTVCSLWTALYQLVWVAIAGVIARLLV